jgi:type II secretory pathway predicted ATPase ExeA/cell division septation protein DedD
MKSESETQAVSILRPTVAEPDASVYTDLTSALAEVEAALEHGAMREATHVQAPEAAASADREQPPSAVEPPGDTHTTLAIEPSLAMNDRDATIRRLTPARGFARDARAKRRAVVPGHDDSTRVLPSGAEFRSRLDWFIGVSDASPQDPGSLTYEPYFGLRQKPFSLASDPRFFCRHSSHGEAFDTLAGGIRRREGILVLTGEVGTGKTTLCRAVLQSLDQKTFAAFVPDPFLSREDLLKTLLVDFGVVSVDEIRSGRLRGATRTDLSYPLYEFLASLQPLQAFAVVMIDEAQNLTTELLEEIRILSDMENGQKLLEVLLVGQPELRTRLATTAMRQLSQRVSIRCELSPLAREDVKPYISRRLMIAGNDGRVQFTDAAIDIVSAASGGIPRVINLACDRALLRAARSRTMTVDTEHMIWAVDDLKLSPAQPSSPPSQDPLEVFASESPVSHPLPSEPGVATDTAPPSPAQGFAAARPRRGRWLALMGGCLALATSFVVYWSAMAPVSGRLSDVPAQPAQAQRLLQARPGEAVDLSPGSGETRIVSPTQLRSETDTKAPRAEPSAKVVSSPPEAELTGSQNVVNSRTGARLVLQMATFQSPTRVAQALQELRDAGYHAYSIEVPLRDGTRALAVFLGPYAELASAERDLDRARQIPGYGSGRVVQLGPSPAPQTSQP